MKTREERLEYLRAQSWYRRLINLIFTKGDYGIRRFALLHLLDEELIEESFYWDSTEEGYRVWRDRSVEYKLFLRSHEDN